MQQDKPLKIIRLIAENVKKLRAIQITPEGHIVQISGPNAAGKTSVLDSIWYGLGGGQALPEEPIRKGAARGEIHLDLGEMIITRTFTQKGSYLKVVSKDGLEWKSPQKLLDKLIGKFSFDPLAFARLDEAKQRELLLSLVTIPLSRDHLQHISGMPVQRNGDPINAMNTVYKALYDQRADHNRNVKRIEAAVASIAIPQGMEDVEPISAGQLVAERRELEAANARNEAAKRQFLDLEQQNKALKDQKEQLESRKQDLLKQVKEIEEAIHETESLIEASDAELVQAANATRDLVDHDFSEIDTRIVQADEVNRIAGEVARRKALQEELDREQKQASECTAKLEAIGRYKTQLMEQTNFPIRGLDFRAGKVVYNGVPIGQASAAEKLRVGMAIAMALNPRLRIIRIEDGSLLDKQSWRVIEEMAQQGDYQVWIETVADEPGQGIYIYDGQIAGGRGQDASPPSETQIPDDFYAPEQHAEQMLM
jgi:DNA repair exonuclease SbcCD ATPase subunit